MAATEGQWRDMVIRRSNVADPARVALMRECLAPKVGKPLEAARRRCSRVPGRRQGRVRLEAAAAW
jgi:hypothetical protein